jgi:hypothetical protein
VVSADCGSEAGEGAVSEKCIHCGKPVEDEKIVIFAGGAPAHYLCYVRAEEERQKKEEDA